MKRLYKDEIILKAGGKEINWRTQCFFSEMLKTIILTIYVIHAFADEYWAYIIVSIINIYDIKFLLKSLTLNIITHDEITM